MTCAQGLLRLLWGGPEVGVLRDWKESLSGALVSIKFDGVTRLRSYFLGVSMQYYNEEHGLTVKTLDLVDTEANHTSSYLKEILLFVLFYLPFLSSIHEKANCIAILWTGSPHSLGSCLFRGLWATCLPHKGGGFPLSALPKDTTSELAGLFSTTSHKCRASSREAIDTIF